MHFGRGSLANEKRPPARINNGRLQDKNIKTSSAVCGEQAILGSFYWKIGRKDRPRSTDSERRTCNIKSITFWNDDFFWSFPYMTKEHGHQESACMLVNPRNNSKMPRQPPRNQTEKKKTKKNKNKKL